MRIRSHKRMRKMFCFLEPLDNSYESEAAAAARHYRRDQ